jgi:hypothetical protein
MRMPNPADKVIRPSSAPLLVQSVCTECEQELHCKAGPGVEPAGECLNTQDLITSQTRCGPCLGGDINLPGHVRNDLQAAAKVVRIQSDANARDQAITNDYAPRRHTNNTPDRNANINA